MLAHEDKRKDDKNNRKKAGVFVLYELESFLNKIFQFIFLKPHMISVVKTRDYSP